jgi:hypothetical protein
MLMVVAGTDVSGSVVGGVVEEVEARVFFFFRSASGSGNEVFRQVESTHILSYFHPQQGRKHRTLACMSKWLPYMHAYFEHIMLDICYPLPSLATVPEMLVGIS